MVSPVLFDDQMSSTTTYEILLYLETLMFFFVVFFIYKRCHSIFNCYLHYSLQPFCLDKMKIKMHNIIWTQRFLFSERTECSNNPRQNVGGVERAWGWAWSFIFKSGECGVCFKALQRDVFRGRVCAH